MKKQRGIGIFALLFIVLLIIGFIALGIYLVKLDDIIRKKFEGNRWDIPAKVYARPLELRNNSDISKERVLEELKLLNYQPADNYDKSGTYENHANQLIIHTRGFDFGDSIEPERVIELNFDDQHIRTIRTSIPSSSGVIRLEPLLIGGIYPQHNEDRVLIKLENVPKPLIDALLSTEDRNFYQHYGVSIRGTTRALLSNLKGGKRQGGSTITQQLVKNFFLSSERTYKRKINEASMAMLMELHYSKNEILESYLNEVNLGQHGNFSINGYGLAAQFYFGQPLRELNTAQLAFLVGLVNGPSYYNPWKYPERALARRNVVLHNMLETNKLSSAEYEREIARPLGILAKPNLVTARFPDFMDLVRRQLRQEYQESDLTENNQGLHIFTTLDPVAQLHIQQSVNQSVQRLVQSNPRTLTGLQGAVIVSQPQTGEVIAAVGSTGSFTGFNRIVDAKRQVGSLLKPIIFMQAIQSGKYTWASLVEDTAITIEIPGQQKWTPKNYAGNEHGLVTLQTALANSYNLATVRLANETGLSTFIDNLHRLGITADIPSYPSIYLGAVNLSPMDILKIYQNFAAAGVSQPIRTIRTVVNSKGLNLERFALQKQNTIDAGTAYLIDYGLQQVMSMGTGRPAYSQFPSTLKLAGKSGTTNDARDSWFAGYSGNYLTVVWLGQDNNKPIGLTGSEGALPVWVNVMKQLKLTANNQTPPNTVQWQWIDSATDGISNNNCPTARYIPVFINMIPNAPSACGSSTDDITTNDQLPDETIDTSNTSTPSNGWLRESDPEIPPDEPHVLSQGGYSN